MLSYQAAREKVSDVVRAHRGEIPVEVVPLDQAQGRVLAEQVAADRDYPPFDRSTRDGFAVRAADLSAVPRTLRRIGESKAGQAFLGRVEAGQCVQIMTGAPMPTGADAVVMMEYVGVNGNEVTVEGAGAAGQNIVGRGSEARAGQVVLPPRTHLGFPELALAAQVGRVRLSAYRRPRVAILSTGDEVVPVESQPGPWQIRNSNSVSLAEQVRLAGAVPVGLGNAPDRPAELRRLIEKGLAEDVLVLSGGVSVGKYDLVENVLRDMGTEFYFDAVAIRPGRPAVFGRCRNTFVFGLPGNPVSTMVTFELFVSPAMDLLRGLDPRPLPLLKARLAKPVEQKAALTHFLPARLSWPEGEAVVEELPWQGSGDIVALARSNCFLVVPEKRLTLAAGNWVDVLPRRGLF